MRRRQALLACAAMLIAPAMRALAQGGATDPAVARIRAYYDVLLAVMKDAEKLGIRGRYEKLAPAVRATFDLAAMTRIAVGPDWNSIAPEQQSALIDTFSRMTIATYASRFDGYTGERFEVDNATDARNNGKIVRTRLIVPAGEPVSLNYLMRASADSWKVVDVYLAGTISELATRRSEFGAILKSGGPNALIESMRQQADKMMRGSGKT